MRRPARRRRSCAPAGRVAVRIADALAPDDDEQRLVDTLKGDLQQLIDSLASGDDIQQLIDSLAVDPCGWPAVGGPGKPAGKNLRRRSAGHDGPNRSGSG